MIWKAKQQEKNIIRDDEEATTEEEDYSDQKDDISAKSKEMLSREKGDYDNKRKIAEEIELYKNLQNQENATMKTFGITEGDTKEVQDPFYETFVENEEDDSYMSFEKMSKEKDDQEKNSSLPLQMMRGPKGSQELHLPFPDHWKTKNTEPNNNKYNKAQFKFREDSNESDMDMDLEDLESTTEEEKERSSTEKEKFIQELPRSSNKTGIAIIPDKMVRNVTIFAMLLVASRFGVLLLLNFLLTLVAFYLSIRYAQIYKEQKEASNQRQNTGRRQTSRPNLFNNDFNESSTVSFNKNLPSLNTQDKKNQSSPNNKNIAFVIPVNKE